MPHLEQILSIFATELMNKQRFGENVEVTSKNVGITLHNMGIVHLLSEKYDEAVQVFERALQIRSTVYNNSKSDHCVGSNIFFFF